MNALICLSGGLDSTVLAYDLVSRGAHLESISFDYGQSHKRELDAAREISELLGIKHRILDFSKAVPSGGSSLTGGEGSPVVPNRNGTMLTLAVTYAAGIGAEKVFYGPTKEDHKVFPDCRREFVDSFNEMLKISECEITVHAPFLNLEKGDVVLIGKGLDVPFEKTWSCYVGGEDPCGKCSACISRKKALSCT